MPRSDEPRGAFRRICLTVKFSSLLTIGKPEPARGSVGLHAHRLAEIPTLPVEIPVDGVILAGDLAIPPAAKGIVLFAHGSGSSRHSVRNQFVAQTIQHSGTATLLFDFLTRKEEVENDRDAHLRFNIALLARRLVLATEWFASCPAAGHLRIGYFGSSTGGAAALAAAAKLGLSIDAVVTRGGRTDLVGVALTRVTAPTLMIVGEWDDFVLALNKEACAQMRCLNELVVVPRATHLFEEPGALDQVASIAASWFRLHLKPKCNPRTGWSA